MANRKKKYMSIQQRYGYLFKPATKRLRRKIMVANKMSKKKSNEVATRLMLHQFYFLLVGKKANTNNVRFLRGDIDKFLAKARQITPELDEFNKYLYRFKCAMDLRYYWVYDPKLDNISL